MKVLYLPVFFLIPLQSFSYMEYNSGGGRVNFSGAVSDSTCDITTNGGKDLTISLSPINIIDAGSTVGIIEKNATPFPIIYSNCTAEQIKNLMITFSGSAVSASGSFLENQTGTSTGIGYIITADGTSTYGTLPFNQELPLYSMLDEWVSNPNPEESIWNGIDNRVMTLYVNYFNYNGVNITTGSVISGLTYYLSYQ